MIHVYRGSLGDRFLASFAGFGIRHSRFPLELAAQSARGTSASWRVLVAGEASRVPMLGMLETQCALMGRAGDLGGLIIVRQGTLAWLLTRIIYSELSKSRPNLLRGSWMFSTRNPQHARTWNIAAQLSQRIVRRRSTGTLDTVGATATPKAANISVARYYQTIIDVVTPRPWFVRALGMTKPHEYIQVRCGISHVGGMLREAVDRVAEAARHPCRLAVRRNVGMIMYLST
jgi:hypothetical protein